MSDINKVAVDTASSFLDGVNVTDGLVKILNDVKRKTEFTEEKEIWKSTYYGSGQIGAMLYRGKWKSKNVILKIQGVKPEVSEIVMVEGFEKQNNSKVVRPPKFYITLPWNDKLGYEAIIMEEINGDKVINSKALQTKSSLNKFFEIYHEYRANCINKPWIGEESNLGFGKEQFEKTKQMIAKLKPESVLRKQGDIDFAYEAGELINKSWLGRKSEFMHGHFSAEDLIYQDDEVVLFSNLFWKWKHKFYDAVFAYHYCMINLSYVGGVTSGVFDSQREMWLEKIYDLAKSEDDKKMIDVALLERMVACLLIDGIMFVDEKSGIADHLIESTRAEIIRLMAN